MKKTKVTMINKKIMAILLIVVTMLFYNSYNIVTYAISYCGIVNNFTHTILNENGTPINGAKLNATFDDMKKSKDESVVTDANGIAIIKLDYPNSYLENSSFIVSFNFSVPNDSTIYKASYSIYPMEYYSKSGDRIYKFDVTIYSEENCIIDVEAVNVDTSSIITGDFSVKIKIKKGFMYKADTAGTNKIYTQILDTNNNLISGNANVRLNYTFNHDKGTYSGTTQNGLVDFPGRTIEGDENFGDIYVAYDNKNYEYSFELYGLADPKDTNNNKVQGGFYKGSGSIDYKNGSIWFNLILDSKSEVIDTNTTNTTGTTNETTNETTKNTTSENTDNNPLNFDVDLNTKTLSKIGKSFEIGSKKESKNTSLSAADTIKYFKKQNITIDKIKDKDGKEIDLNSGNLIGTGTKLYSGNEEYTVIVYGDPSGDGLVNAADINVVIQGFLGDKTPTDLEKTAADTLQDGNLDAGDISRMIKSFLGTLDGSIVEKPSESSTN